jgi:hypothetical protein
MVSCINLCAGRTMFAEDSRPWLPTTKTFGCSGALEFHVFDITSKRVTWYGPALADSFVAAEIWSL